MSASKMALSITDRTKILGVNILIAWVFFAVFSRELIPTGGLESVWLLSAIAFWFLALLSSPWFQPPKDILINAIAVASILVTVDLSSVSQFKAELEVIRWVFVAWCGGLCFLSLSALFLHDSAPQEPKTRLTFKLGNILGKAEIIYMPPAIISIAGAYQSHLSAVLWLLIFWVTVVIAKPVELIFLAYRQWKNDRQQPDAGFAGSLIRIDHPNIVRVRLSKDAIWPNGALYALATAEQKQEYMISLFSQVQDSEVVGTGLCAGAVDEVDTFLSTGQVKRIHKQEKLEELLENISGTKGVELIGFVVENSTIGLIKFEVSPSSKVKEGDVVFCRIDKEDIFYQILDAETAEESFNQNPRGTCIVKAAQLGAYSADFGFTKYPWLPAMNTPIFAAKNRSFEEQTLSERDFILAKIPSTKIEVAANIDDLVEYHTAILGATGTGKTEVALEIIREALKREVKVFCVDFTGDYKHRLSDLTPEFPALPATTAQDIEQKIFDAETGAYGGGAEKKTLKTATDTARTAIEAQVSAFLTAPDKKLAILELSEITNTRASLLLTEIYLSSIMNWARNNRGKQKTLLVLEEAHTIVPEVAGAGFDYNTQWVVGRIGQIALQGRKYGVGLMVISQRTALVSKTILSQCNTFLTHSLIDQTSLNFLENVYSSQHSRLIPNLAKFQFIAQGKALRTERPIILGKEFDPTKATASKNIPATPAPTAPITTNTPQASATTGPLAWSS